MKREIRIKGSGAFLRSLAEYLEGCSYSDAIIICDKGALIGAHRAVLSALSPFLRSLFLAEAASGDLGDDIVCLQMPGTTVEELGVVMELAYKGYSTCENYLRDAVLGLLKTLQVTDRIQVEEEEVKSEEATNSDALTTTTFGYCSLLKVKPKAKKAARIGHDGGGDERNPAEPLVEVVEGRDQSCRRQSKAGPRSSPSRISGVASPKKRKKSVVTVEFSSTSQPLPLPLPPPLSLSSSPVVVKPDPDAADLPVPPLTKVGSNRSKSAATAKESLVSMAPSAPGVSYCHPSDILLSVPYINGVIPDKEEADRITREVLEPCTDLPEFRKSRNNQIRCICPNCASSIKGGDGGDPPQVLRQGGYAHVCHYPDCGKRYKKTSHLRAHLRLHVGLQPFLCSWPSCDRRFTRSDELHRHYRIHTGEKNHKCSLCEKTFARSDHLKKHILTHSSSWSQAGVATAASDADDYT